MTTLTRFGIVGRATPAPKLVLLQKKHLQPRVDTRAERILETLLLALVYGAILVALGWAVLGVFA